MDLLNWRMAFLLLLMQGCVMDDLSECGVSIHYQYTKNIDGTDKFTSEVKKVNLYVFDSEGLFLNEYSTDTTLSNGGNIMYLNISPGTYDLIAWGNAGEDYELTPFEKGKTTLKEARLSLKRTENKVDRQPGSLFFGALNQIKILPAFQKKQILTIDMMKDTKKIRVITKGLSAQEIARNKYDCRITSVNGDYKFDNSIATPDRLLYMPQSAADAQGQLISDFVVMRELNDGSTQSKLIVNVHSPDGKPDKELFSVDLTELLLAQSKTKNLDMEDYFEIEITVDYANGTTSIHIKGWNTIETGNIIG
ncbi:MAG: FimB/Mfa2 family fimbrial subunit [Tannerellaceae bacterium]|nr:FimB/Mfa2 family fimbrial subunit [Tannerellaceae bacterium]